MNGCGACYKKHTLTLNSWRSLRTSHLGDQKKVMWLCTKNNMWSHFLIAPAQIRGASSIWFIAQWTPEQTNMSFVDTLRQWDEAVTCAERQDLSEALRIFLSIQEPNSKICFDIGCLHLLNQNLDAAEKVCPSLIHINSVYFTHQKVRTSGCAAADKAEIKCTVWKCKSL